MLEKHIVSATIEFLNYQGCFCWRNNAGNIPIETNGKKRMIKVGRAGESDIFGIHKKSGRFIAIEIKLPKRRNRVTPAQQNFIDDVLLCNGIAGIATSPEEALKIIEDQTKLT